jgi:hypothetical protein
MLALAGGIDLDWVRRLALSDQRIGSEDQIEVWMREERTAPCA